MIFQKNKPNPKGPTSISKVKTLLSVTSADLADISASGLYKVWAVTVPSFNESVKFVPPFNMKQKGQMARLGKLWGPDAGTVMAYVLANWIKFGKFSSAAAGIKSYPEVPSTDYLLKHGAFALNFYLTKPVMKDSGLCAVAGAVAVVNAIDCTASASASAVKLGKIVFKKASGQVASLLGGTVESDLIPLAPLSEEDKPISLEEVMELYATSKAKSKKSK